MPPEVASPQQFAPSVAQGLVCAPGPRLSLDNSPQSRSTEETPCHLAGLSAEPQADRNWQEQGKLGDTQQQGAQSHLWPAFLPNETYYHIAA